MVLGFFNLIPLGENLSFFNEEDNYAKQKIYYGVEPLLAASMKVVIKKAVKA